MSYMPWKGISFTATAITSNQRTHIQETINNIFRPVYYWVSENVKAETVVTLISKCIMLSVVVPPQSL